MALAALALGAWRMAKVKVLRGGQRWSRPSAPPPCCARRQDRHADRNRMRPKALLAPDARVELSSATNANCRNRCTACWSTRCSPASATRTIRWTAVGTLAGQTLPIPSICTPTGHWNARRPERRPDGDLARVAARGWARDASKGARGGARCAASMATRERVLVRCTHWPRVACACSAWPAAARRPVPCPTTRAPSNCNSRG